MAIAAHPTVIEVSTDNITFNEIDGINDYDFDLARDVLETTDFKDTSGGHTRILGLQDVPVSISGDYEGSDTNGQNVLRTALVNGTSVWIGFLFNGSAGYKVEAYVSTFKINAAVDGKVEFSCEFVSTGSAAAHS